MHRSVLATVLLLVLTGNVALADSCSDRLLKSVAPKFPTNPKAARTLLRQGACAIIIEFSLTAEGTPVITGSSAEEKRCLVFGPSSIRALRASTYAAGEPVESCAHKYFYSLDE